MLNTSLNFSWVYNANVTITSNIGNGAAGGLLLAPVGTPTAFIVGNIAATISNNTPAVNLTGGSLTVTGNVTGGTSGGAVNCGISKSGTAILSVIGNVYGSAGSGINNAGSGLFTLVGNMYPASAALGYGINNAGSGDVNITSAEAGRATGGNAAYAFYNASGTSGTIAINSTLLTSVTYPTIYQASTLGSMTVTVTNVAAGSSTGPVIYNSVSATIAVNGTNIANTGSFPAIQNATTGIINITANITGGFSGGYAALNSSTGTINVVGTASGSDNCAAISNASTGTVNVTTLAGNTYGPGNVVGKTAQPGIINTAGGTCNVKYLQYGPYGSAPVNGACNLIADVTNTVQMATGPLTSKTLLDGANTTFQPSANDVRSTTTFNAGTTTGSMAVPLPASVAAGVPVDATIGTAVLTAAAIFATDPATLTTGIGARLKNCATTATVGTQIQALR